MSKRETKFRRRKVVRKDIIDGYKTKKVIKKTRKGRIEKTKSDERLLVDEPSKGGVYRNQLKQKIKDGRLKKSTSKVVDKEGHRKTKIKKRLTRKGVLKTKTVVWEDGKRKVYKRRNTRTAKGYRAGGRLPSTDNSLEYTNKNQKS